MSRKRKVLRTPPLIRVFGRRWMMGLTLIGVLGLGWMSRGWFMPAPKPPALPIANVDADVLAAIRAAREKVLLENSGPTWGALGQVLRAHGYDDDADQCLRTAQHMDDAEPRWPYLLGKRAAYLDPSSALESLSLAAKLADTRDSDNACPRLLLAECFLQLERLDEAAEQLNLAAKKKADNPRLAFDRGVLAAARNQPNEAIAAFRAALASPYFHQKAANRLAALEQTLDHSAEALRYEREAAKAAPDRAAPDPYDKEVEALRAGASHRLTLYCRFRDAGRDVEALQFALDIAKSHARSDVYNAVGESYARLGRLTEAETWLRKALALDPSNTAAHNELASTLFRQGQTLKGGGKADGASAKFKEALEHSSQVLSSQPNNTGARLLHGTLQRELGDKSEALTTFREAVRRNPEEAEGYMVLGDFLGELGQRVEAESVLRRAVELAKPGDKRPQMALDHLLGTKR